MLLEQYKEKDENEETKKIKSVYDSSNVLGAEYNKMDATLTIYFKRGANYSYYNVKESDFQRFDTAESQGKALNEVIKKGDYRYQRNEDTDPTHYQNEVKRLINQRLASLQSTLYEKMESTNIEYKDEGYFPQRSLEEIETLIGEIKRHRN